MNVIILLTMIYGDGYLGGGGPAAEFKTMAECESFGIKHASQMTNFGHPATFTCSAVTRAKIDPKSHPAAVHYDTPKTITP